MSFEGKIAAPAGTDHKGPPSGKPVKQPAGTDHKRPLRGKPAAADAAEQPRPERAAAASHEDEKMALIVAGVGVGLLALWLASR